MGNSNGKKKMAAISKYVMFFLSSSMFLSNGIAFDKINKNINNVSDLNMFCDKKCQWKAIVNKSHTQQAIWWLNGFWGELEKDEDYLWNMVHIMIEIESGNPKLYGVQKFPITESCDLNQNQTHLFFEKIGEQYTQVEFRAKMIKLDVDKNKRFTLSEYLVVKYNKTVKNVINAPQGVLPDRVIRLFNNVVSDMKKANSLASTAADKLDEAKIDVAYSDKEKKGVEDAVAEVERHEEEREKKIINLKSYISNKDGRLSTMEVNTYKNELAQVEGEDPLPLRFAKQIQKKKLKTSKAAKKKADQSENALAKAKDVADKASEDAKAAYAGVKAVLAGLNEFDGIAHGKVWWLGKELLERSKYLPKRRV